MKIRLPIPEPVLRACDAAEEWLNRPLLWRFRYIDPLLALLFIGCTAYYWSIGGWQAGVTGALMFIFVAMCAQWFWRRD